jgi:hypothetical protein
MKGTGQVSTAPRMPGMSDAPPSADEPGTQCRRDRLTWIAYLVLAWFAYLQAAPGLVIAHLRDELHLSYSTGGLHVAALLYMGYRVKHILASLA